MSHKGKRVIIGQRKVVLAPILRKRGKRDVRSITRSVTSASENSVSTKDEIKLNSFQT